MSDRSVTATEPGEPQAATLPPQEAARWLLPLLREYAAKVADLSERSVPVTDRLVSSYFAEQGPGDRTRNWSNEAGRVICLYDTLQRRLTELTGQASGLLEHAVLDYEVKVELKLRLDELEECLNFAAVMMEELGAKVKSHGTLEVTRKVIEKTRYKSPI
jgi:hypothetical protein